jgi:hypothetical protein
LTSQNSFAALTEYYIDCQNGTDNSDCYTSPSTSNECLTIQYFLDNVTIPAGGARANIEYDGSSQTCTLSATIDIDTPSPTIDNPLVLQGYSSTVGDRTKFVVDADSTANNCFNIEKPFVYFVDMECKNTASHAMLFNASADYGAIVDSYIHTCTGNCVRHNSAANNYKIIGTEIYNGSDQGIYSFPNNGFCYGNYLHDITNDMIGYCGTGSVYVNNVFDTASGGSNMDCGLGTEDRLIVIGNTFYNGADNFSINSNSGHVILSNIFNDAVDKNVQLWEDAHIYGYNSLYDNGGTAKSGEYLIDLGGEQTSDPSLNTTTFQASGVDDQGYPQYFDNASGGTTVPAHYEIGATMYEETAGGGGTTSYGFSN